MTAPPAERGRLAAKVALVVGAGAVGPGWSNGRAAAVAFAREGAAIFATDIDEGSLAETAAIIRREGGRCETLIADAAIAECAAGAATAAHSAFGRLDILHYNVGVHRLGGPVELEEADWDLVMAANVKGLFLACRHAIPLMQTAGSGSIVVIGSIAGSRNLGLPQIAYATSKAAISGFARELAAQYGRYGIRANVVVPGVIDTPLLAKASDAAFRDALGADDIVQMRAARAARIPIGRFGTAWDVAALSVFLASEQAAYITGTEILVDGGLSTLAV